VRSSAVHPFILRLTQDERSRNGYGTEVRSGAGVSEDAGDSDLKVDATVGPWRIC
jgi:hypothetical protein